MVGLVRIAKNSTLVLIARATDVLSGVLMVGILARYLGVDDYGNYLFIMGLVITTTAFVHLGLPQILIREMSQKKPQTAKFIQAGLSITLVSLLLTVLIICSIGLFSNWKAMMFVAVFIALWSEAMVLFSGPFISAFISFEKMHYDAIFTITTRVIVITSLLGVVYWDLGFLSIFFVMAFANIVRLSIIAFIARRNNIMTWKCKITKDDVKYLFKETLPVGVSYIFTQLFLYTNLFMLKTLHDSEQVALFQAPFSIILKLQVLPAVLIVAFAPVMARLAINDSSFNDLKNVYSCIMKYLFILCLPLSLIGAFFGKDIVVFVFGTDFADASVSFQISIWMTGFFFLNFFSDKILQLVWKQRLLILSSGITFAVNILLSFLFVSKYGYIGASIAILLSTVILFTLNFYFVSRYLKGVSLSFIIRPLIAFSFGVLILYGFSTLNPIVLILFALLVYFAILYALKVFSRSEFNLFHQVLDEGRKIMP